MSSMNSNVVQMEEWTDRVEELGEFTTALDSIDASMKTGRSVKEANRDEITLTPEALASIVDNAVADAIAAYERAHGLAPHSAANPAATPPSPWRTKLARLQGDMGFDEIAFNDVPVDLAAEMGIDGFGFEDAPLPAAEPATPAEVSNALSAWDEALKELLPDPGIPSRPED